MQQQIYEVSQINEYLKLRFEEDEFLSAVFIRGEISNYKLYPSGHHYFSLKDANGAIRCVMFKGNAFRLRFRPPSLTGRAGTGLCYLNTGINYQNDTIIYIIIPLCLFSDAKLLQKESFHNTFMSFYFHQVTLIYILSTKPSCNITKRKQNVTKIALLLTL